MAHPPSNNALSHRVYRPDDRAACMAVFDSNVPRYFHPGEAPEFSAFLDHQADRYLVVCDGNQVVGCGGFSISDDGRQASLCWGMVRRDRHGQRIGERLLQARLAAIATTGARSVRLSTSPHTAGFYRRCGFEVMDVEPDGLAPGLDAVEMRLSLPSTPARPVLA